MAGGPRKSLIQYLRERYWKKLPVWLRVGETEVYDYSPSLLNVKGLDWERLGEDEVIRQLCFSILAPRPAETGGPNQPP
jgi:hypothetical protein